MSFSTTTSSAIKVEGFDIPGTSSQPGTTGINSFGIDPSDLFGGFGSHRPTSSPFSTGGTGGFSDLDLEFENTLASLTHADTSGHHHHHGASTNNNPSHHLQHHNFSGAGAAGSNGYLGSNDAFNAFGYQRSPDLSSSTKQHTPLPPPSSSSAFGVTQAPHSLSALYLSSSSGATARNSIPAFAASPRDARSPVSMMSPSPHPDLFTHPIVSPAALSSHDSPGEFGSYSSVGDSFASPAGTSTAQTSTSSSSTSKRRASPPESGAGRSRSTQVGKAPTSSTRSRSARRQASTSGSTYQSLGTAASASHGSSAIVIPSSSAPGPNHHPLAMSMPAYPSATSIGNGAPGGGAQNWFASAQAIAFAHSKTNDPAQDGAAPDPTGWKPSAQQTGPGLVPSSAPVLGATKKGKAALDDVPEDPSQKQAAALNEKRRKRRESHNAVERRRRDNINDRITELASLLPEALLEQATNGSDDIPGSPGTPLTAMLSPAPGVTPLPALGTSPATPTLGLGAAHMAQGSGTVSAAAAAAAAKPNKGIILSKSVEYIRYLQQLVELHAQRNGELESMVRELQLNGGAGDSNYPMQHATGSTGSFDTGSAGTSSGQQRSPENQLDLSNAHSAELLSFNEHESFHHQLAASNGMFGADNGGWPGMHMPKQEEMDES